MSIFRTLSLWGTGIIASGFLYSCTNSYKNRPENNNESSCVFEQYSTQINGEIDKFCQGATDDCWLLAELSSLSGKSWGKDIIKNAIKADGAGGAIVTIKENELEEKQIRITKEEIISIRKKQEFGGNIQDCQYSTGDADVLVLELAIEKYFHSKGDLIDGFKIKNKSLANIIKLLTGNSNRKIFKQPKENSYIVDDYTQILDTIEKDSDKYVTIVGFQNDNKAGLKNNHAYELREIKTAKCGHKIVKLVDPHNSSEEINIDYYSFLNSMKYIKCNPKPGYYVEDLKQVYYEDFDLKISKFKSNKDHETCCF